MSSAPSLPIRAGLLMDRFGRVPVLASGFAAGVCGCLLAALGSAQGSAAAVLAGLVLVGTANATALLARTAAGDMYPAERRARGIALVLFGTVFGAILGPAVFSPLLAGRELDGDALSTLWLAAGGFMLAGMAIVLTVRPDPKRIAELLATHAGDDASAAAAPAAPLRDLVRRPGVVPALVAAQASFAVMVAVMTLTGAVVVDHHHHGASNVFPIIGAHVIGMFGLIIVVGDLVDRVGRTPALAGGLLLMGLSTISLLWVTSVPATAVALFGARSGLERLVRRRDGGAGRQHRGARARQAAGLQRPARRVDRRRPRAARRFRADGPRRRRAGDRRRGARGGARAVDPAQRSRALGRRGRAGVLSRSRRGRGLPAAACPATIRAAWERTDTHRAARS